MRIRSACIWYMYSCFTDLDKRLFPVPLPQPKTTSVYMVPMVSGRTRDAHGNAIKYLRQARTLAANMTPALLPLVQVTLPRPFHTNHSDLMILCPVGFCWLYVLHLQGIYNLDIPISSAWFSLKLPVGICSCCWLQGMWRVPWRRLTTSAKILTCFLLGEVPVDTPSSTHPSIFIRRCWILHLCSSYSHFHFLGCPGVQ